MKTQAAFLAAAIQQPLLILDRDLRCIVANPAFCGWFGGKPDIHEGVALLELAGGEFARPDVLDGLRAVLRENIPRSGLMVPARDMELELQVCPVTLEDEPALMIIFMRQPPSSLPPISPDDEIELLWALLADGPYILFETDGRGVVRRLSAGFERLTGWPPDYWLGKSAHSMLHPEDVVRFFSPQIALGNTWLNALRMMTRSGEYRRVEVCTYPLIGPDGNVQRVFGICRDMTEYFVLLDRRKNAESEARALFAAMDDIVVIASRKGHIERVLSFPEGILPWRGDESAHIGGPRVEDMLSPVISAEGVARLASAIAAGTPLRHEFEYGANQDRRWFSATYSPLDDERVLIVAHDITDGKRAEQRAVELALARERTGVLERLVADVSHDLRNPITVLRASTFLLDQYLGQLHRQVNDLYENVAGGRTGAIRSQTVTFGQMLSEMHEQVKRLENSLQRIQSSVEARLYEVRAEHGVGFEFGAQPLDSVIEQATAIRRADAMRRGQSLTLTLDGNLPPVQLDVGELSRALRILIGRVLQDAPDNAVVNVATRRADGSAVVEVFGPVSADPLELTRLADPAYRAARMGDQWHSSHDLTIAQRIVLAHGGKVGQETRPGGVRVWQVWLPLGEAPGEASGVGG